MNLRVILKAESVPSKCYGESSKATEGWIQIDCPFCYPQTRPGKFHMGLNPTSMAANCWKCGKRSILQTLSLILKKDRRTLWELLDRKTLTRTKEQYTPKELKLPGLITDHNKNVLEYLRGRYGHDRGQEIMERFELGFFRKRWRVFVPIYNYDGEFVSYTTRAIGNIEPRYVSASRHQEIFPHKNTLYGEWLIKDSPYCVIVEGPTDVWNLQPLLPAIATFGVSYTPMQVLSLLKYDTVVICYDADMAGRNAS